MRIPLGPNAAAYIKYIHPEAVPGVDFTLVDYANGIGPVLESWAADKLGAPPTREQVDGWDLPITDVESARQYAGAYQAAEGIIFLLMARVSMALIGAGLFTQETVNGEGTRFVFFHRAKIEAFKLAGRHPDAGDALYTAIMAPESIGAFSWLEGPIGQIFATGLPRNP